MPHDDWVVRSHRVATPAGVVPAAVSVRAGRITGVHDRAAAVSADQETDLGRVALLPGSVDIDVAAHTPGEPLRECYTRAASAALRGGVTTLVAAPSPAEPAVVDAAALEQHQRAASTAPAHLAFLAGVTGDTGPAELAELHAAGAAGFYCSLSDGGGPDLPAVPERQLRTVMAELAAIPALLLVHPEDGGEMAAHRDGDTPGSAAARPQRAERRGVERIMAAVRATGAPTHVCPFTAADSAALLEAARAAGLPVSAQTCPHYLCLPASSDPEGRTSLRGRPPLRSEANRQALWSALLAHTDPALTVVGSGHCPATGMATLPWTLPALWTEAAQRGRGLTDLVRWTATNPAALLGLRTKGRITAGYDADLVAFDTAGRQPVPTEAGGPYAARRLSGRVTQTWVAGRRVYPAPDQDSGRYRSGSEPHHRGDIV